jgi:hypothetical protein
MRSYDEPTPEQVNRVVALLARTEQRRYFFDKLDNPKWIAPLRERGFFQHPPEAIEDRESGTISYVSWPESRYLSRMASVDPQGVFRVAIDIPQTDNVRVYEDIADAALHMPVEMAAELVRMLMNAMEVPHPWLLPKKLGVLLEKLAEGQQVDAALQLARFLLRVAPDPRSDERTMEYKAETIRLTSQPRPTFDAWNYSQIIEKNLPTFVRAVGEPALILLCEILDTAIYLYRNQKNHEEHTDYSSIWYPAIESDPRTDDVMQLIVSAVRDSAEGLIASGQSTLVEVVKLLRAQRWPVAKRLELHILRRFGDDVGMIEEQLTDRGIFDDTELRREYALLARDYFNRISSEGQTTILSWIDDGPDMDRFKLRHEEWTGTPPTQEIIQAYTSTWRRDRLTPVRDQLTPEWLEKYQDLIAQVGEPDNPGFLERQPAVWMGPTSPKSAAELNSMRVGEIVSFLSEWVPSNDLMTPSPEGLARDLKAVIASDPNRFAAEAEAFIGLDSTYVRSVLAGLEDAIKQNRPFDWQPVLGLCEWVLSQPREIHERPSREDTDPDWGWTRQTIAELLKVGLQAGPSTISSDQSERVWRIIEPLSDDENPTSGEEERYGKGSVDPATYSLNTVRGQAIHAVIQYALWVRRQIEQDEDGERRIGGGFDEMPGVRAILDRHLDIREDPSFAIRSEYGQWFPWLLLLDGGWARENIPNIFPHHENLRGYWDAAWRGYITLNRAYDNVFELLRGEYAFAIEQMARNDLLEPSRFNPDEALAEHLILFYWRGQLPINDPLLRRFFEVGSDERRARVLAYIGRGLCNNEVEISVESLSRLQALWAWRFEEARGAQSVAPYTKELSAYGWWFASGRFDDAWSIAELRDVLQLVGNVDSYSGALERLGELAPTMPALAVECLGMIIDADRERWHIDLWRDPARTILAVARRNDDPAVRQAAKDVINLLGSRGFHSFRDLLA